MWQLVGITIVLVTIKSLNIECVQTIPTTQYDHHHHQNQKNPSKITWNNEKNTFKKLQKRSIVKLDFHDGANYQLQQLSSPEELLSEVSSYWPNIEMTKIIRTIEQHRNDGLVLQERRNPSFSPWGGKRDSSSYKSDPKIRRPARVPFNSWGGKRDSEKIIYDNDYNNNNNNNNNNDHDSMVIKKPFNSWGGKRSANMIIEDILRLTPNDIFKKTWQYPSAYAEKSLVDKRTGADTVRLNNNNNVPRIPFEPWGGRKRRDTDNENNDIIILSSSPSTLKN